MTKKELEKKVVELEAQIVVLKELLTQKLPQQINIPSVWTTPECQHEWPNGWGGTTPPCCMKCGKQNPYHFTITTNSAKVYDDKAWESWHKK